ncbi:hypothetical protein GGS23DRAFT_304990 [Durotheca rogersii]|uniref:uncharacterized protein n=1 Tax=Durotheca rogersii TaxID=419775 RepID=UPI00221F078A|nr:uncharacterized protein GGS23DRAFT_304990 [Durotheca rogersii]KAI5867080.1 hypothetical protein GGS23DRAFT_304990 [Durotheca rogersii]
MILTYSGPRICFSSSLQGLPGMADRMVWKYDNSSFRSSAHSPIACPTRLCDESQTEVKRDSLGGRDILNDLHPKSIDDGMNQGGGGGGGGGGSVLMRKRVATNTCYTPASELERSRLGRMRKASGDIKPSHGDQEGVWDVVGYPGNMTPSRSILPRKVVVECISHRLATGGCSRVKRLSGQHLRDDMRRLWSFSRIPRSPYRARGHRGDYPM